MPADAAIPPDLTAVRVLLCDADGNLFPSEEPAFEASVEVLNRLLKSFGSPRRLDADEARRIGTGKTFRALARELAGACGARLGADELERWVAEERAVVSRHLSDVLRPDPAVRDVLERLARRYELAVVSSSALARLAACFTAAGLDDLLPAARRFSAEDSLPEPTSKPDPAIYRAAAGALRLAPHEALAIEDSVTGAQSALGAGIATLGNVCFVAPDEREERVAQLRRTGCFDVVDSWAALERRISAAAPGPSLSAHRTSAG